VRAANSAKTALIPVAGGLAAIAALAWIWQMPHHEGGKIAGGKIIALIVVAAVIGLGIVTSARVFGARRKAQAELSSGEQYRRLADEYRRLADVTITVQEHTDLKLSDVSARIGYLRDQMESLQKILKEVE
jgi:flagellar basal body-associated protein FliL